LFLFFISDLGFWGKSEVLDFVVVKDFLGVILVFGICISFYRINLLMLSLLVQLLSLVTGGTLNPSGFYFI